LGEPADESGLHEYIDATIFIESLTTPAQEKALYAALDELNGVHNVSIKEGKVWVKYEPVCVTEQEIVAAIQSAGFRVADQQSAPSSPLTDAFVSGPPRSGEKSDAAADEKSPQNSDGRTR